MIHQYNGLFRLFPLTVLPDIVPPLELALIVSAAIPCQRTGPSGVTGGLIALMMLLLIFHAVAPFSA